MKDIYSWYRVMCCICERKVHPRRTMSAAGYAFPTQSHPLSATLPNSIPWYISTSITKHIFPNLIFDSVDMAPLPLERWHVGIYSHIHHNPNTCCVDDTNKAKLRTYVCWIHAISIARRFNTNQKNSRTYDTRTSLCAIQRFAVWPSVMEQQPLQR